MDNLVKLDKIKKIAIDKNIDKYILKYGYANDGKNKYYIININGKKIKFGALNYQDYIIHQDDKRRSLFRSRFKKLYEKNKNNINSKIFYSWNILW